MAAVTPDQRQSPPSTPKIYYLEIKSFSLNVSRPLILGFWGEGTGVREREKKSSWGGGGASHERTEEREKGEREREGKGQ